MNKYNISTIILYRISIILLISTTTLALINFTKDEDLKEVYLSNNYTYFDIEDEDNYI